MSLSFHEIAFAGLAGVMRRAYNATQGNVHRWKGQGGWHEDIPGALAEFAVAKYLGCYWTGMEIGRAGREAGDVGRVEVRYSLRPEACLILHPSDVPNKPYVLVTGEIPTLTLRGWRLPADARRPEYWRDPQGTNRWAYFVPQSALYEMDLLLAHLDDPAAQAFRLREVR